MMGPRACRKYNHFIQEATKQQVLEQEKERYRQLDHDYEYSNHIKSQNDYRIKGEEDVTLNNELQNDAEAITFWSYKRFKNDPDNSRRYPSFAKCTCFTNDIRDGRLSHSEAT
mmetsp:Transcript_1234/g.2237  ORF Transcript_1234/g.2237 Transcript_1234/m.2237 type:complete len:113 (-) Transcript_1234:171-509(-)